MVLADDSHMMRDPTHGNPDHAVCGTATQTMVGVAGLEPAHQKRSLGYSQLSDQLLNTPNVSLRATVGG